MNVSIATLISQEANELGNLDFGGYLIAGSSLLIFLVALIAVIALYLLLPFLALCVSYLFFRGLFAGPKVSTKKLAKLHALVPAPTSSDSAVIAYKYADLATLSTFRGVSGGGSYGAVEESTRGPGFHGYKTKELAQQSPYSGDLLLEVLLWGNVQELELGFVGSNQRVLSVAAATSGMDGREIRRPKTMVAINRGAGKNVCGHWLNGEEALLISESQHRRLARKKLRDSSNEKWRDLSLVSLKDFVEIHWQDWSWRMLYQTEDSMASAKSLSKALKEREESRVSR